MPCIFSILSLSAFKIPSIELKFFINVCAVLLPTNLIPNAVSKLSGDVSTDFFIAESKFVVFFSSHDGKSIKSLNSNL